MIICHCAAVNERRIVEEIVSGALDANELAARCGAGRRCGSCVPTIETLLTRVGLAGQPAA